MMALNVTIGPRMTIYVDRLARAVILAALLIATVGGSAAAAPTESHVDKDGVYYEGLLLDVDAKGDQGVVNLGTSHGVNKGDRFIVIRKGEAIVDPVTKKFIRTKQILVGELEIIAPNPSFSDVKFRKGGVDVKKGDYVRSRTAPPSGLKVEATSYRQMRVLWPYEAQPDISGYVIYRSGSKTGPFKEIGTLRSATDISYLDDHGYSNELKDSATYYYRVETINLLNVKSEPSEVARGTTLGPPPPPDGLKADGKIRSVTLYWNVHPVEGVTGYRVYRSDSPKGPWTMLKDIRSRTTVTTDDYGDGSSSAPRLAAAARYLYAVSAYSKYGDEGPKSSPVGVTTKPAPTIPTGFEGLGWQPRKIPLEWNPHPDENVRGYYVYRSSEEGGPYQQIADVKGRDKTEYVDAGKGGNLFGGDGLKDFTSYFYKIAAYNWADSRSELSAAVSATTKAAPLAPEEVKAIGNRPKQIPLSWRKNPEVDLKEYEIFRSEHKEGDYRKVGTAPADQPYFLNDKLDNAQTFWYKIRVVDKFGIESSWSVPVTATTKSVPRKVTGLSYSTETGAPRLRWEKNPEIDIDHYTVYQKGFFGWSKKADVKETSHVVGGMKSGDKEDYAIAAVDVDGLEGERSGALTVELR
jgi:fibronectin type 3 domain-containing protein